MEKLTPKQIENWRSVLLKTMGPIAADMSDDEIEQCRNVIQAGIDKGQQEPAQPAPVSNVDTASDLIQREPVAWLVYADEDKTSACFYGHKDEAIRSAETSLEEYDADEWPIYPLWAAEPEIIEA